MSNSDKNVLPVLRLLLAAFFGLLFVIALQLLIVVTRANAAPYPQINEASVSWFGPDATPDR
jgi:hypothetical protein